VKDNAEALAENIQHHVDTLLQPDPSRDAQIALQRDAQQLDGRITHDASGHLLPSTSQAFRDTVQADLQKLEKSGHLPIVRISSEGDIFSETKLPGTRITHLDGVSFEKDNTRSVTATSDRPAQVSKY
jgi:hypothetical protein